jgi:putative heme transporter
MSQAGSPHESPRPPAYAVVVPAGGLALLALLVAAVLAGVLLIDRGSQVIALVAAGIGTAILLQPALRWLDRRIPSALAYIAVVLGFVLGTVGLLALVTWDLDRQASALSAALTDAVDEFREGSLAARVAESLDLATRIGSAFDGAAARWVIGTDDPIAIAGLVAKVVVVAVLAAFMLSGGDQIIASAIATVRRTSIRQTLHTMRRVGAARGGSFVRRTMAVSAAHGMLVAVAAWLVDLPGPVSLGAWAACIVTVPIVGGPLAWLPVVGVAWAEGRHAWWLVALAVAMVVADRWIRRTWVQQVLRLGPLLTLVGLVGGYVVLGLSGAILGLLATAMVAAVLAEQATAAGEALAELIDDRPISPADEQPVEFGNVLAIERVSTGREPGRVVRMQLSLRTSTAVAAVAVGAYAVYRGQERLSSAGIWLVVGGFIACGLDRPVSFLVRRTVLPRIAAIALVLGAMTAAVAGIVAISGPAVTDAASEIVDDAPQTVTSLETLPIVGRWLAENDASERVQEWIEEIPDRVGEAGVLDPVAAAAGDGIIGVLLLMSTLLAALLDAPRLVRAARRRVPVERRARVDRLAKASYTAVANVAAAAAFVATLNGTVVMLLALALGIPLALLLGVWAAAWNLIPQVGGFVGAAPLVALGLAQSPWAGIIALVVFITYQTFENHVIQPFVNSRAVHIPPLMLLIGVLVGGTLGGFVGAVLAGPILGVAKIVIGEWRGAVPTRLEDRTP